MPETTGVSQQATRDRYLEGDRSFKIRNHMENLEKEEKNGLKGIEIRSTVKSLGKDDFLKLLITQLSSQDPTNPVKDQDFIAQMAQFSSLEQMNNISTGIQKMGNRQSFSLVGKLVSGPDFVNGESIAGIAGALFFRRRRENVRSRQRKIHRRGTNLSRERSDRSQRTGSGFPSSAGSARPRSNDGSGSSSSV